MLNLLPFLFPAVPCTLGSVVPLDLAQLLSRGRRNLLAPSRGVQLTLLPREENTASNWEHANKIDTVCLGREAGTPCCFLSRRKVLREKYLEAMLSSDGNVC